jgi:hypothetical protein
MPAAVKRFYDRPQKKTVDDNASTVSRGPGGQASEA